MELNAECAAKPEASARGVRSGVDLMHPPDSSQPIPVTSPPTVRRLEMSLAKALCLCVVLGTLVRHLGRWHWVCEITTHFVVQATILAGIATLLLLIRRHGRLGLLTGLLTVVNAAEWLPYYSAVSSRVSNPGDRAVTLHVVSANVYSRNRRSTDLYRWLQESQADVVFISEVDSWWADQIGSWKAEWPHQVVRPREDNFGLALISRHPMADAQVFDLDGFDPAVHCRILAPRGEWTLVGLHPFPPAGRAYSTLRNQQLATAAKYIATLPKPRVVLGDLNSTSSSPMFHDFLAACGLRDSRIGFGWQPTWPAGNSLLRIPIDHCLLEPELQVLDRQVGPDIGSDHLPIRVRIRR